MLRQLLFFFFPPSFLAGVLVCMATVLVFNRLFWSVWLIPCWVMAPGAKHLTLSDSFWGRTASGQGALLAPLSFDSCGTFFQQPSPPDVSFSLSNKNSPFQTTCVNALCAVRAAWGKRSRGGGGWRGREGLNKGEQSTTSSSKCRAGMNPPSFVCRPVQKVAK